MITVNISELPLIKTAEAFFSTDKILYVDFLKIGNGGIPNFYRMVKDHPNVFRYLESYYYQILLTGSSHNLFKAKNYVPFKVNDSIEGIYKWEGNLQKDLLLKKIYDFTEFDELYKNGQLMIAEEYFFMVDRFIKPIARHAATIFN